jgi:hypothetical protein
MGQGFGTGEMEICKDQLVFLDKFVFQLDGFLHFHNHLSDFVNRLNVRKNLCASHFVAFIIKATSFSGSRLNVNFMTRFFKLSNTGRC